MVSKLTISIFIWRKWLDHKVVIGSYRDPASLARENPNPRGIMPVSTSALPAHELLDVLRPPQGSSPTDAEADEAVKNFMALLAAIKAKHVRKSYSQEYILSNVFGRVRELKNDAERGAYCRTHLTAAVHQLSKLISEISDPSTGAITLSKLRSFEHILNDYVFDLSEIISYLERKTAGFVYLRGHKNHGVHSWEGYVLSRQLAYQSIGLNQPVVFAHKPAQIASIFVLRQSLELRFERLVAVYPTDRNGKGPKLKHGFHQEFIGANSQFFLCNGFDIKELQPVYDWCSEVVHLAFQPFAWQIALALDVSGRLLAPRSVQSGKAWNIANAVEVINVSSMQEAFEAHFLSSYDHGSWRMTRKKPEALIRNWTASMAFTATDFRQVERRLNRREKIRELWLRFWLWTRSF